MIIILSLCKDRVGLEQRIQLLRENSTESSLTVIGENQHELLSYLLQQLCTISHIKCLNLQLNINDAVLGDITNGLQRNSYLTQINLDPNCDYFRGNIIQSIVGNRLALQVIKMDLDLLNLLNIIQKGSKEKTNDTFYAARSINALLCDVANGGLGRTKIYIELSQYEKVFPKHINLLWFALQLNPRIEEVRIEQPSYFPMVISNKAIISKVGIDKGKAFFYQLLMQTTIFNPFLWQLNTHFSGMLRDLSHCDEQALENNITLLCDEIKQLSSNGFFDEYEAIVKDSIKDDLQGFAVKVLAFDVLNLKIPKYTNAKIEKILQYSEIVLSSILNEILRNASEATIHGMESNPSKAIGINRVQANHILFKLLIDYSQTLESNISIAKRNHKQEVNVINEIPYFIDLRKKIRILLNEFIKIYLYNKELLKLDDQVAVNIKSILLKHLRIKLTNKYKDFDDLNSDEQVLMIKQADKVFADRFDPLWSCHLTGILWKISYLPFLYFGGNKNPLLDAFQNGDFLIPSRREFINNNTGLQQQLIQLGFEKDLREITAIEDYLTKTYLSDCTYQLKFLEQQRPGFLVRLLELLLHEQSRLEFRDSEKYKVDKICCAAIIEGNKLQPALDKFKELGLQEKLYKLDEKLRECIEKKRFDFYVDELRQRENRILQSQVYRAYAQQLEEYHYEVQQMKDDPDSVEQDYDGPVYPQPPQMPQLPQGYFSHEMFDDLTQLKNLLEFSRGAKGLDWLVHHKVEYDFNVVDDAIEKIIQNLNSQLDVEKINLEPDLISFILGDLLFDREYQDKNIFKPNFIASAIIRSLKELSNDAKKSLKENINNRFAKIKPLIDNHMLDELMHQYNAACERSDLLTMQKMWSIFTRTQHLIGTDKYQEALKKEIDKYKEEQKTYYMRIYPTADTTQIVYPSKNQSKVATLNIQPIMHELVRIGRAAKNVFIEYDKADETNLLTATFYFLVSDSPHDANNKTHKRIFVPVQIQFPGLLTKLLSMDTENIYLAREPLRQAISVNNDEEKVLLHILFIKKDKKFRKIVFDSIRHQMSESFNKQGENQSVEQLLREFIISNNFLKIILNAIKGNAQDLKEFNNQLDNKKMKEDIKNKKILPDLIAKFANELFIDLTRILAELYSKKDHSLACEFINNFTGFDYAKLFEAGSEHPDDHSERVFLHLLRNFTFIQQISDGLKKAIEDVTKKPLIQNGKYKVYWAGLFLFSSNSECNNCTLSLIGLQNSYQNGFLKNLIDYLNGQANNFKVRGSRNAQSHQFQLTTIVAFDKNLTEQSHHLTGEQKLTRNKKELENTYYNPVGKLSFFGRAINIKERQMKNDGTLVPYNGNFFEYHTKFFHLERDMQQDSRKFTYDGVVFMSGLKCKKFGDQSDSVDEKITPIILRGAR